MTSKLDVPDHIRYVLRSAEVHTYLGMSLSSLGRMRHLSKETIDAVVKLTTETNMHIAMPDAMELYELGLVDIYTNNLEVRAAIDAWFKTREYAGLTIRQFIEQVLPDTHIHYDQDIRVP